MKNLTPVVIFLAFTGLASHLGAQSIADCAAAPLSTYDAQGFDCRLNGSNGGILLFGAFSFSQDTSSYTDSQIEVTPVPQGQGGGFSFSLVDLEPFSVPSDQSIEFGINYDFIIQQDPFVDQADLGMDPPFGTVTITENLCVDPVVGNVDAGPSCSSRYAFSVDDTNPPASWTNSVSINPPVAREATVGLDFVLTGGDGTPSGFDALSATNHVTDTLSPEPVSSVLGLGGLLAVALRRRYRKA